MEVVEPLSNYKVRVVNLPCWELFDEQPEEYRNSILGDQSAIRVSLEAGITALSIKNGAIPPTINLVEPDPECDLDYTPNLARRGEIKYAMSNSFGFGGHNASLVFGNFTE